MPRPVFLTAEWRHLVMASYAVAPEILANLVPPGTELDFTDDGRTFVSLVGFRFLDTRLLGGWVRVPWHADFSEINLRFYVRRRAAGGDGSNSGSGGVGGDREPPWRRGTVFVKEIVPLPAVAMVARLFYGEKYLARPVRHTLSGDDARGPDRLEFRWRTSGNQWNALGAVCDPVEDWRPSAPGSLEEWISEHYYGYSSRRSGRRQGGRTTEYAVEHPRWRVRPVREFTAAIPAAGELYGEALAEPLRGAPDNVFVAEGSAVLIRRGVQLPAADPPRGDR